MSNRVTISALLWTVALALLQVTLLRELHLFEGGQFSAFCFAYAGAVLIWPSGMARGWQMVFGLLLGLGVDVFYNSLGVHAAATVILAYVRPLWLQRLLPDTAEASSFHPYVPRVSFGWFLRYALPLLVLHHVVLLGLEAARWSLVLKSSLNGLLSSLFSFSVLTLLLYLIRRKED